MSHKISNYNVTRYRFLNSTLHDKRSKKNMAKSNTQKNLNPYISEHGCTDRHDMAIDGYGITIGSIKS